MTLRSKYRVSVDDQVRVEIADLADLSRSDLCARWQALYHQSPPRKLSRVLMEKALAYEIQCKAYGGLSTKTKRALRAAHASDRPGTHVRDLTPGARLIREWNGVTHHVEIAETGYLWQGTTWRSLSAIAKAITGSAWSGPRFFGLTKRS